MSIEDIKLTRREFRKLSKIIKKIYGRKQSKKDKMKFDYHDIKGLLLKTGIPLDMRQEIIIESVDELKLNKDRHNGSNRSKLEKKLFYSNKLNDDELTFVTDKCLYKEIKKYLNATFPNHKNNLSERLRFDDKVMKGSSTYIAVAIDMFCKSYLSEYRLATQLDLEQDLKFTQGTYNDSGLSLRNLKKGNRKKAIYLFNQLKKRNVTKYDFPIFFNLRGLDLDGDLNFNLTDESLYTTAICLDWGSETAFLEVNCSFGLPQKKDKDSIRKIYTSNSALSGVYLCGVGGLGSGGGDLAFSGGDGRVVLKKSRSDAPENS